MQQFNFKLHKTSEGWLFMPIKPQGIKMAKTILNSLKSEEFFNKQQAMEVLIKLLQKKIIVPTNALILVDEISKHTDVLLFIAPEFLVSNQNITQVQKSFNLAVEALRVELKFHIEYGKAEDNNPVLVMCPACAKHARLFVKEGVVSKDFHSQMEGLKIVDRAFTEGFINEAQKGQLIYDLSKLPLPSYTQRQQSWGFGFFYATAAEG